MIPRVPLLLTTTLLCGGCLPGGNPSAATQPTAPPAPAAGTAQAPADPAAADLNAKETGQRVFQIQMYRFSMPAGAISKSVAFWKPADETFLGFNTHEILNKNGVRVGKVPLTDVQAILGQLEGAEVAQDVVIGPGGTKEIEMRTDVPGQTIFWYDLQDAHMEGQTFGRSQNLYVVTYRQVPRRTDQIHIRFSPAVRELRTQLRLENGQVLWNPPDTIYSLGIDCELAADECVVIAPSPVATTVKSVVGAAFLLENAPAQRMERILVIVPRVRGVLKETDAAAAPQP